MQKMKITAYARLMGVTRTTVWNWIRKGAIRVERVGHRTGVRVLVTAADLSPPLQSAPSEKRTLR